MSMNFFFDIRQIVPGKEGLSFLPGSQSLGLGRSLSIAETSLVPYALDLGGTEGVLESLVDGSRFLVSIEVKIFCQAL